MTIVEIHNHRHSDPFLEHLRLVLNYYDRAHSKDQPSHPHFPLLSDSSMYEQHMSLGRKSNVKPDLKTSPPSSLSVPKDLRQVERQHEKRGPFLYRESPTNIPTVGEILTPERLVSRHAHSSLQRRKALYF